MPIMNRLAPHTATIAARLARLPSPGAGATAGAIGLFPVPRCRPGALLGRRCAACAFGRADGQVFMFATKIPEQTTPLLSYIYEMVIIRVIARRCRKLREIGPACWPAGPNRQGGLAETR
jgi:hypothetical protein